jgi:anti-sigma regulatory factor (Ser/Thr protein kinase)
MKEMKALGELTLAATLGAVPEFATFVSAHAAAVGYSEARVKMMESAVTEALTNVAEFVCTEEGQEVTVSVGDDKGRRFVIDITDSGKPFNMLLEGDPLISGIEPGRKRPSVRFMKRIGDVEYKRFEGKNHLILTAYPEFKPA